MTERDRFRRFKEKGRGIVPFAEYAENHRPNAEKRYQMSKTKRTTKKRNPDCLTRYAVTSSNVNLFGKIVDFEVLGKFKNEEDAEELFVREFKKKEKVYYNILKIVNGNVSKDYQNKVVDYYIEEENRAIAKELGIPYDTIANKVVCEFRI